VFFFLKNSPSIVADEGVDFSPYLFYQ